MFTVYDGEKLYGLWDAAEPAIEYVSKQDNPDDFLVCEIRGLGGQRQQIEDLARN